MRQGVSPLVVVVNILFQIKKDAPMIGDCTAYCHRKLPKYPKICCLQGFTHVSAFSALSMHLCVFQFKQFAYLSYLEVIVLYYIYWCKADY